MDSREVDAGLPLVQIPGFGIISCNILLKIYPVKHADRKRFGSHNTFHMKKAENLSEIAQAFGPEPLDGEENIEQFFCETMAIRMNSDYSSPLEEIYEACCRSSENNAHLLLGHKGCGKSTELNRLKFRFEQKGHRVVTIHCLKDADIFNIDYWDLLILISDQLCQIAKDTDCQLDDSILQRVDNYWKEIESVDEKWKSSLIEGSAGVGGKVSLVGLLKIFSNIKGEIKYGASGRKIIREHVKNRPKEWIDYMKEIAIKLTSHLKGKHPIILIEDLDKIETGIAVKLFKNTPLSMMPFPIIYTFPIDLYYTPDSESIRATYRTEILPMIKISTIEGEFYEAGITKIKEIIGKRVNLDLLEEEAISLMIQKTGGCLRELFRVIFRAAGWADRKKAKKIEKQFVQGVLDEMRSDLTSRIEEKDYEFLARIHNNIVYRQRIQDKEHLLKMMQGMIVLEYNGVRWRNLHPLVAEFLEVQGILNEYR